jgi:single-stranded-DNA-specific exonuclease
MVAFGLGPRFNAAGRLDNAELALNVLMAKSSAKAKEAVEQLEYLNQKRRALQDKIYQEAFKQAEENDDAVLVLSGQNWHEGVVGIVASKIMEQFSKPVFILQNKDNVIKGSARSFGDFSIAAALQSMPDIIEKGGGHAAAGGLTLKADNLLEFTKRINAFYKEQGLTNQLRFLQPKVDANLPDLHLLTLSFYRQMEQLAPFGVGNPEPIFEVQNLRVKRVQKLGRDAKHLKLNLVDEQGVVMDFLGFNLAETYTNLKEGDSVSAVFNLTLNEWQGRQSVEGRLIDLLIG